MRESNALVDSVLTIEKHLSTTFNAAAIRSYIDRNNQLIITYSDHYVNTFNQSLNGMVERRFKASIHQVASFWYSAWIDAGQPKLMNISLLMDDGATPIDHQNKKIIGREEWH